MPSVRRKEPASDYPRPPRIEPEARRLRIELGGWVTDEIEGPYKGEPGTEGW